MHRRPLCFTPTMLRRFPPQVLDYLGLVDVPNHEYVRACVLTGLVRYRVPPVHAAQGGGDHIISTRTAGQGEVETISTRSAGDAHIPSSLRTCREFCKDAFNRAVNGGACGQMFVIKTQPTDGSAVKYLHRKLNCKVT